MDPLSEVLALLDARGALSARLVAGGRWCINSPAYDGLRFGALVRGACELQVEGAQALHLRAGDCYLLTDGRPYRIGSDLSLAGVAMGDVLAQLVDGVAYCGTSADLLLLGGRFELDAANAPLLLDALAPVIHIPGGSDAADVQRWIMERLALELAGEEAGASAMVGSLTHMMMVQILRQYLASGGAPVGWMAALQDARIGKVLRQMHALPMKHWLVAELAAVAGMSRSAFAARFSKLVGTSPLDYLLRWRMRLAGRALLRTPASVGSIAFAHGYESEAAFSNAFKRVVGSSPRDFRGHNRGDRT